VLLHRSRVLLEVVEGLVERGEYDLALSLAEQAAQLAVKAVYARLLARIPRGHSLRRLLGYLASLLEEAGRVNEAREVRRLLAEQREGLVLLEDAYTQGRYSLPGYTRGEAEKGLEVARRLVALVERLFGGQT